LRFVQPSPDNDIIISFFRASNPMDPQSVVDARNIHKQQIHMWIAQWMLTT